MPVSIRTAEYKDFDAYAGIIQQLSLYHIKQRGDLFQKSKPSFPVHRFFYEYLETDGQEIFLAWENEKLLGVILVRIEHQGGKTGFILKPRCVLKIDDLVVDEAARGQKIGLKLMKKAENWGKQNGATHAELSVFAFNENAQAFYEHQGYKIQKLEMEKSL